MRYVMSRILGTDGGSKGKQSPGVHLPLGDRGGQSGGHGRAGCGRWPKPSLLCADGRGKAGGRGAVRRDDPAPDSSAKRA